MLPRPVAPAARALLPLLAAGSALLAQDRLADFGLEPRTPVRPRSAAR